MEILSAPVFFGSVNRWECDENDHLNVRFFSQKMHQTLQYGLIETKIATADTVVSICRSTTSQHMRYIAEARTAVPISGYFSVIAVTKNFIKVMTELKNTSTGTVLAVFTTEISGDYTHLNLITQVMPDYAAARGVSDGPFYLESSSHSELLSMGFCVIGKGVIQADECDEHGFLQNYQYMGRNSDSMPNLFARFEDDERGKGVIGGAVLEYRMNFKSLLKCGDRFELISGVRALGDKTQSFVHILINSDTGAIVTGSEALAITMDLVARKAVSIPAERRAKMEALLLKEQRYKI